MARLRSVDGVVPAVLADGERGGPGGGAGRSIDMDAVEFIRERNRMCNLFSPDCEGCRMDEEKPVISECDRWMFENPKRAVKIVEEWAKEYPRKTRQSEFLKQWPGAIVEDDRVLGICPALISLSHRRNGGECLSPRKECGGCRREFWMQEVE